MARPRCLWKEGKEGDLISEKKRGGGGEERGEKEPCVDNPLVYPQRVSVKKKIRIKSRDISRSKGRKQGEEIKKGLRHSKTAEKENPRPPLNHKKKTLGPRRRGKKKEKTPGTYSSHAKKKMLQKGGGGRGGGGGGVGGGGGGCFPRALLFCHGVRHFYTPST